MDGAWLLTTFDLPTGAVATLRPHACASIECDHGILWLTITGDPADYFVATGVRLDLQPGIKVLVEAIGDARVRMRTATPTRSGRLTRRRVTSMLGNMTLGAVRFLAGAARWRQGRQHCVARPAP